MIRHYCEIEPQPEVPPMVRARWMVGAYLLAQAIAWPVDLLTGTGWGLFGYVPFGVAVAWRLVTTFRRGRKFHRDSDAWMERMHAYYAEAAEGWRWS